MKLLKIESESKSPENIYVIDGGWLLHRMIWPKLSTFETIGNLYINYVVKHFGGNIRVVFEGYNNIPSTKDEEHRRSYCRQLYAYISRTSRFFKSRKKQTPTGTKFQEKDIITFEANGDADILIVNTAIDLQKIKPPCQ